VAVVALNTFAQVERPAELIGGGVPALRKIELDRLRIHRAGLEPDEALEHPADDRLVGGGGGAMRIERSQIGGGHADVEHFLGSGWNRCRQQQRANEAGGDRRKAPHRYSPSCAGYAAAASGRAAVPPKRPMSNAPSGLSEAPLVTSSAMMIPITGPS